MKAPVYLDNNASTPLAPEVIDKMLSVLKSHWGNPSSSTHAYGWYAEELVTIAREQIASLINAEPEEIVFTSGATESINLALKGFVAANHLKNCRIVASNIEHHAVLGPLESLHNTGASYNLIGVNTDGLLDIDSLKNCLASQKAELISIIHANNEIGVIQDAELLVQIAHSYQSIIHLDASQSLGKIPIDVKKLNVDLLSFSSHKLYGPKGVGALYIRRKKPRIRLKPLIEGGGQEHNLRSGTLNVPGIVGFGEACAISKRLNFTDQHRALTLRNTLWNTLKAALEDITLNGHPNRRLSGNLNISIPGISASSLISKLTHKLAISASSACQSKESSPSHVLTAIGLTEEQAKNSIRIGIGRYNTEEEINLAAKVIIDTVNRLR